ncbi:hypothetical protein [Facklamia hominis]|uniref:hypothetical protein n=1 Tax=Facklamia hominis TaxID=178214 RepID=UPI0038FC5AAA
MNPWEEFRQTYPYGKLQFTTKVGYTGIIRITDLDTLCGYVVLPQDQAFFEKILYSFDDRLPFQLDVHGGVTFAGYLDKGTYAIGFDCHHIDDYIPGLDIGPCPQAWKSEAFVRYEIERLANQLKKRSYLMIDFKKIIATVVFLPILLISNYLTFTIVVNFITGWPESLPRQILIAATASVCLTLNLIVSAGLIYAMVRGGDSDDESY